MWTSKNVKTDLNICFGPKMTITCSMSDIMFSAETTTETLTWSKNSQREKETSISSCE